MFCKEQKIRFINLKGNPTFAGISDLEKFFKNKEDFKEKIKNKTFALVPCGKCEVCLNAKKRIYSKRVNSQFKMSNYAYLITLTFDNDNITTLLTKNQRLNTPKDSISYYSTLSKTHISNIIKNWKNKLNRFYKEKVPIHYLLSGEYGGRTERAHYHIVLILDKPIPKLQRENVRGNHYKSELFNSTQYSMYDIEPINLSNGTETSNYLTKYLTKDIITNTRKNYNRFEEEQIQFYKDNDIDLENTPIVKNKQQFINLLSWYLTNDIKFLEDIKFSNITFQKEFIKVSRGLGISEDNIYNINNNVFLPYYRNRYIENFAKDNDIDLEIWSKEYINNLLIENGDKVLDKYERKRKNNIDKYLGKNTKIVKKRKNNNDIF